MAEVKGAGDTSYIGCLAYGPFEIRSLRSFTIGKTYIRQPVEILRTADRRFDAVVRHVGRGGAFAVNGARLEAIGA